MGVGCGGEERSRKSQRHLLCSRKLPIMHASYQVTSRAWHTGDAASGFSVQQQDTIARGARAFVLKMGPAQLRLHGRLDWVWPCILPRSA